MKVNGFHIDDELLAKYLLGEAETAEQEAVKTWITLNPANQKYFEHFQLIWETSKQIQIPATINTDDAWKRFQQRTQKTSPAQAPIKVLQPRRTWMKAAAIAILAIGTAALSYFLVDTSRSEPVIVSAGANPVRDTLPDGSLVTLNKNSSISYEEKFTTDRKITVKGEAFFDVTPDKTKPFVIDVNDVRITVVGTSFNVKNVNGKTQVLVETGIVKVTRKDKTLELHPGEKLLADPGSTSFAKDTVTDQLHQYYRSKEFVCDNTPLWKLVEVLNDAYGANIVIGKRELKNLPLTTIFYNESLDKILSVIAETFEISVVKKGDQIILQ